ncbi:MAG: polysaccharide deacetylase family protein [Lachnospiraceae bacterium]|nr:polysaccharide deacetylase family protein [Lachnospiraceae bacterium]
MGKVLTLLYHRVTDYKNDPQMLCVTPVHFEEQIKWISSEYKIVRFDDDWGELTDDAVCITFDDGYRDNFLNAVPILNSLNQLATIFVSTGNIDTKKEMWWDELERNFLLEKKYHHSFVLKDKQYGAEFNTVDKAHREDVYKTFHWLLNNFVGIEKRNDWFSQLQNWNGYSRDGREENYSLQTRDLKSIDLKNITIGAHTLNHPRLSMLTYAEQKYEITQSLEKLEMLFNREINTFSYPFGGKADYNSDSIKICQDLYMKRVAANFPGIWDEHTDEFQVPRNIVRDWELEIFKQKIKEFWRG